MARPSKSGNTSIKVAWWLNDGDEECPHCGRMYIYELEFRCHACDGPACPHCTLVHAEGHAICPDCFASNALAEKNGHG